MFILFVILTLIAAILMICVVLVQKSKGGGLSSTFAGSNQIMGVRRTNNFIEKVTWTLAVAIAVLAVLCAYTSPSAITRTQSRVSTTSSAATTTDFDSSLPTAVPEAGVVETPGE